MSEKGRAPRPDAPPCAKPGSGMLLIPTRPADPMRLAEESIEELKKFHQRRRGRTRGGAIGAPQGSQTRVLPESEDWG